MLKEEAVKKATEKWEAVEEQLKLLSVALYQTCAFCDYFEHCETCPLGSPEKGPGKGCEEYTKISNNLIESRDLAKSILKVIKDTGECQHTNELEVTNRGDKQRVFICSVCGRHRFQSFTKFFEKGVK